MTDIVFDISAFRLQFPAFASITTYPNATVNMFWGISTDYISKQNYGVLRNDSRAYALNLLTAHILALNDIIAAGEVPGIETSATIDKISVTTAPPPYKDAFDYWLQLTPYGAQLAFLLAMKAAGGLYVGARDELGAFRKSYGCFR